MVIKCDGCGMKFEKSVPPSGMVACPFCKREVSVPVPPPPSNAELLRSIAATNKQIAARLGCLLWLLVPALALIAALLYGVLLFLEDGVIDIRLRD